MPPDPGAGYSDTPEAFDYSFDGYAEFLDHFVRELGLNRFVLYLHDFGTHLDEVVALVRDFLARVHQHPP